MLHAGYASLRTRLGGRGVSIDHEHSTMPHLHSELVHTCKAVDVAMVARASRAQSASEYLMHRHDLLFNLKRAQRHDVD